MGANKFRFGKTGPVPGHMQRTARIVDQMAKNFDLGLAVDPDTITVERLQDGRIRLHLKDDVKKTLRPAPSITPIPLPEPPPVTPPPPETSHCDLVSVTAFEAPVSYDLFTVTTQQTLCAIHDSLETIHHIYYKLYVNGVQVAVDGTLDPVFSDSTELREHAINNAVNPGDVISVQVTDATDTSEGIFYDFSYCLYFDNC